MMELVLHRGSLWPRAALLGELSVGDTFLCDTLEPPMIMRRSGDPTVAGYVSLKQPGHTAIPAGRYQIRTTWSVRFARYLPQLMDVPDFQGIRIHAGNTAADTQGCLLVGKRADGFSLVNSRACLAQVMQMLRVAERAGAVWITISNPLPQVTGL